MFRISLLYACQPDHPLVQLAAQNLCEQLEDCFDQLYCPDNGRSGLPIRMIVDLLLLKYARGLSDKEVEWWLDNPYAQYFCDETHFQLEPQLDASSPSQFRHSL